MSTLYQVQRAHLGFLTPSDLKVIAVEVAGVDPSQVSVDGQFIGELGFFFPTEEAATVYCKQTIQGQLDAAFQFREGETVLSARVPFGGPRYVAHPDDPDGDPLLVAHVPVWFAEYGYKAYRKPGSDHLWIKPVSEKVF